MLEARARVLLVAAHEILRRRAADRTASPEPFRLPPSIEALAGRGDEGQSYAELVPRVRATAEERLPAGASLLVVSRGDPELLRIRGRNAEHFPQDRAGAWAGFYPADGEAAVRHLEELIARGHGFIVFPSTGFWWLDHYAELAAFLGRSAALVAADRHCLIFDLHPSFEQEVAA